MKRISWRQWVVGLAVVLLVSEGAWATSNINPCCVLNITNSCLSAASVTLTNITLSPTNVTCVGSPIGAFTSLSISSGQMLVVTNYLNNKCAPVTNTLPYAPTILSNCFTVIDSVGSILTNDCGTLSALFTATNCGSGTVTFKVFYTALPCVTNGVAAISTNFVVGDSTPVFTNCPPSTNVQCIAQAPDAPASLVAVSSCGSLTASLTITTNAPANSCTNTITRTWTAINACGVTGTCQQVINVQDTMPPVLSGCPSDIHVQCMGDVPALANVTANDNCEGTITPTLSETTNTFTTCSNEVVRVWTATDSCGNSASCTQKILVADTTPPTVTCPVDIVATNTPGHCSAVVTFDCPTATDNCPGTPTVVCNPASGSTFNVGTNIVTVIATDLCGNTINCTFKVIVNDTEKPRISCVDMTVYTPTNGCSVTVSNYTGVTASDNCGTPIVTYAPATPHAFDKGTNSVTATTTDTSGNTADCTFNVIVVDNVLPVIAVSSNRVICISAVLVAPTATDNCPGTIAVTPTTTNLTTCGSNTVTWTAIDASGNTATTNETVLVYAVDLLTASEGSAPNGPTNYVCWASNGVVEVTAGICGGLDTNSLPGCWNFTGGDRSNDVIRTVVKNTPATTTFIATAGTSSKTNVVVVWKADVQGVKFSGANFHGVWQDNGSGLYPTPHWTPTTSSPVSYTRNTTGEVTVTLSVAPSSITNIVLRGDGSAGVNLAPTSCSVVAGTGTLTGAKLDVAFPNQVDFFNPMVVSWKASTDGGATFCDAGASTNQVYITLNNPAAIPLFHTVLHLACSNGHATTANAAVANTWALFSTGGNGPANASTWDGRPLYYYRAGLPFSTCKTTAGLLSAADGNGQCGAWKHLFIDSVAANGVTANPVDVLPAVDHWFLVKAWTFGTATAPTDHPPHYWKLQFATNTDDMVPVPSGNVYGDLTNLGTLTGQNSSPPAEKVFIAHFIAEYGGTYYDPSYGVTYTGANDFEDKAVDGYAADFGDSTSTNMILRVKKSSGLHEINFR